MFAWRERQLTQVNNGVITELSMQLLEKQDKTFHHKNTKHIYTNMHDKV